MKINPCDYWSHGCDMCPFGRLGCESWYSGSYSKEDWVDTLKEMIENCKEAIDNLNKE